MRRDARQLREDGLAIWRAGLAAVDSRRLMHDNLRVVDDELRIGDERIALPDVRQAHARTDRAADGPVENIFAQAAADGLQSATQDLHLRQRWVVVL